MQRILLAGALTIFVAGCTSDSNTPIDDAGAILDDTRSDDTTSDANTAADDADHTPTLLPSDPGFHSVSLEVDGRERTFGYFVPQGYEATQPYPLLFVFHGGGGQGSQMRNLGFEALTAEEDAVVVYPDGVEGNWADGRGTTDPDQAGVDDVAFVADMIGALSLALTIDDERIWATGVSNGGLLTHRLACELVQVRAAAPVISAFPSNLIDTCQPSRPIPMLAIQGTEDSFMTLEGGDSAHDNLPNLGAGGAIESAQATMDLWATFNGCDTPATIIELPVDPDLDSTVPTRYEFRGCDEDALIDYYIVEAMGHTWPPRSGPLPAVSGPASLQLDATELIWAFFQQI